jgi:hypothetical protein
MLYGGNGFELKIDNMDIIMTKLIWESSRLYNTFNKTEKKFLQDMVTKYQIYVITESSYRNADQYDRILFLSRLLLKSLDLPKMDYSIVSRVRKAVENSLNADFRVIIGKRKFKNLSFSKGKSKLVGGGKQEFVNERQELDLDRSNRNVTMSAADIREMNAERRHQEMLESNQMTQQLIREQIENMNSSIQNTNTALDGTKLIQVHGTNSKQAREIAKLQEYQLQGKDLADIAYEDLPKWMRVKTMKALKGAAISTVTLPLTSAKAIVKQSIFIPMDEARKDFLGRARILWGYFLWFIVIGKVVHIYCITDPETVDWYYDTFGMAYAKQVLIDPGVYLTKSILNQAPEVVEDIRESSQSFLNDALQAAMVHLEEGKQYLTSWARAALMEALSHVPGLGMFM